MPSERVRAFGPGRVNLIGEHTDYNEGLALPFAIAAGVTVQARASGELAAREASIRAHACDIDERDEFPLRAPERGEGWRGFVRGTVAELQQAGYALRETTIEIAGGVPQGAGLSSSAALEVALALALIETVEESDAIDRRELARLCARVENDWVGAQTGLLDQLACLFGAPGTALLIDFRTLEIEPVPLELDGWRLVVLDSGERHTHAGSGYNTRRSECAQACELLGVGSLRDVEESAAATLPAPLNRRARHILGDNRRVLETVEALREGDLTRVGALLNESHASLREDYEISTERVDEARERLLRAGAAGARMIGGGFGGSVLGLFAPGAAPPEGALEVEPGAGARLLEES